MHPDDISVMFCLATMHLKDGRWDKAKAILSNIVTIDEQNADAANLLEEVEHVLAQQKNKETRV